MFLKLIQQLIGLAGGGTRVAIEMQQQRVRAESTLTQMTSVALLPVTRVPRF
jgi:hypothetical protein